MVFVGKSVKADLVELAGLLQIPNEFWRRVKYVELDEVFNFAYNFSKSETGLLNWVKCMPEKTDPLGKPGLKEIHAFAKPAFVLGKQGKRDERANWAEKKGPLKCDKSG